MDEYLERFSYLNLNKVLKQYIYEKTPFLDCLKENDEIDAHKHLSKWYFLESMGSYQNALDFAGVKFVASFSKTSLNIPLDYQRVRNGENKYIIREIFRDLYDGWDIPPKIPMPRPTNEWFADWVGPIREEFKKNCVTGLTGDQKWLLWSLEKI